MLARDFIYSAELQVQEIVTRCITDDHLLIARYAAAIAGNFQLWLAFTKPRNDTATGAVQKNFSCEKLDDHQGMLLAFAKSCGVHRDGHYAHTEEQVQAIFRLFTDQVNLGLSGVALGAVLENTSKIFIPDLAARAAKCGCTDFTYTGKHGVADAEHSDEFLRAFELEQAMGYDCSTFISIFACEAAVNLIAKIYG